ncbi:Asp23/Gls24 family envelope stress response protein [Eubacteriales bacterium OttesenSCG-928-N14]|nr:Asp23/Gls24 family envelope stress response protein [Eubacteriales bacterium OttesenSCG-928-N14]
MAEKTNDTAVELTNEKAGKVTFNSDVIATIAGLATIDIEGVAGMSGGVMSGMTELLGRKNFTKGVKVEVGTEECAVDLNIIVQYGAKIPEICKKIQKSVKSSIETMTGLTVVEVNIHIQGVMVDKKQDTVEIAATEGEETAPKSGKRVK